jgi:hypothetical protein
MTLALVVLLIFLLPLTLFVMSRGSQLQPLRVNREEVQDAPSNLPK